MATYVLGQYETRQYGDADLHPLAGGKVYSYLSGSTTPAFTYADNVGTPNPNPLILSAEGRGTIYLDTTISYKFIVTDANDVVVSTTDPINPLPTVTPGSHFSVAPGSPAFPGFTFTGDENTGIYSPGADLVAVTTAGTERLRVATGVNIGGTLDPGDDNLRVEGTLTVQGASTMAGALTVGGLATLSGGVSGSLNVTGVTVNTLGVTSLATIATLNVTGNETVGGTLDVTGGTTLRQPLVLAGMTDLHGVVISAQTTGRPLVSLENATSGVLAQLIGTAAKGVLLTTNGGANYTLAAFASGGVYIGGPTPVDPGANSLQVAGTLTVAGVSTLTTLQVTTVPGNPAFTGNVSVAGSLGVGGLATLGACQVTGAASVGTTLVVGGATTLQSALGVTGAASVGTTLTVGGATTLQSTLGVTGAATVGGTLGVTGATTLLGNVGIGSSNVTDAIAVPTIASGFGTGPTIGGRAYAFKIVVGSGLPTGGTVNFNQTYAVPPAVVVTSNQLSSGYVIATSSTTQVTIQSTNALQPTTGLYVLVRGV